MKDGLVYVRISVCMSLEQNLLWYVLRSIIGGKISNSGRTGLDLGLVCDVLRYKS